MNTWLSSLVLSVTLAAIVTFLIFLTNRAAGIPTSPKTHIFYFLGCSFATYYAIVFLGMFSSVGIPGAFSGNILARVISWIVYIILALKLAGLLMGVRAEENRALQERRDRRADAIRVHIEQLNEGVDIPIYALYLRAFAIKNKLASQHQGTGMPTSAGGEGGEYVDFETILEKALEPEPLIALGEPGEMIGAGRIGSSNDDWKALVAKLAGHAEVILLLPSDHKGTLWEIEWLRENDLLSKCIWIMPEAVGKSRKTVSVSTSPVKVYKSDQYDPAPDWGRAVEAVKAFGIELPFYENRGMLFVVDRQGKVGASQLLALSETMHRVAKVRKGVSVLKKANRSARHASNGA